MFLCFVSGCMRFRTFCDDCDNCSIMPEARKFYKLRKSASKESLEKIVSIFKNRFLDKDTEVYMPIHANNSWCTELERHTMNF